MLTLRGDLPTLSRYNLSGPYVMTIGNFDGIHAGHQVLIKQLIETSRKTGAQSLLLTFDPHPLFVLSPDKPFRMIMSMDQKEKVLSDLGLDVLAILTFTSSLSQFSPRDFALSVLRDLFHPSYLFVGEGFRFGHGRTGTIEDLRHYLGPDGVQVSGVLPYEDHGIRVSSSRIRKAVDQGEMEEAARLLTRPLELSGPVMEGEKRGRTLGFPTLNLIPPDHRLIPPLGVYATRTEINGLLYDGVTYIGTKPTFGTHRPVIETHLFSFSKECYGVFHRVFFYRRLRGERSFSNVEALVSQIATDAAAARRTLHDHPFTGTARSL
ncbi:MAG: bifunctional riboflavin kinase/FAD synthetase [Nitrospirota bacterium]|nr:bifunctional riboflavin kinase/FAD synthetase [Nitrospirota bacterium]